MIVALGHEAQNGKDAFCIFLIDHLRKRTKNLEVTRVGFADRLYDFCYSVYSWAGFKTRLHYSRYPHEKEIVLPRLSLTPRQILIYVGEHMRAYDGDVWLNAACRGNKKGALTIITDLRKVNEFKALEGFPRIKITRPGFESRIQSDVDLADAPWDFVIQNAGSLKDLSTRADLFCTEVILPFLQKEFA